MVTLQDFIYKLQVRTNFYRIIYSTTENSKILLDSFHLNGYTLQDGPEEFLSRCMKPYGVTIQIKATEQYFPFVLFMMLYKMVLKVFLVCHCLWMRS